MKLKLPLLAFGILALVVLASGCTQQPPNPLPNGNEAAVAIREFAFVPATLTVKAGSFVTWTNEDSAPHNIQLQDFTSETMNRGEQFRMEFREKGTFDYICGIHPAMKGRIIVE